MRSEPRSLNLCQEAPFMSASSLLLLWSWQPPSKCRWGAWSASDHGPTHISHRPLSMYVRERRFLGQGVSKTTTTLLACSHGHVRNPTSLSWCCQWVSKLGSSDVKLATLWTIWRPSRQEGIRNTPVVWGNNTPFRVA